ncbi:chorismate lyase, partial [Yersinia pestis]|nr:chorismate lyase [Yersinia pestis]
MFIGYASILKTIQWCATEHPELPPEIADWLMELV